MGVWLRAAHQSPNNRLFQALVDTFIISANSMQFINYIVLSLNKRLLC